MKKVALILLAVAAMGSSSWAQDKDDHIAEDTLSTGGQDTAAQTGPAEKFVTVSCVISTQELGEHAIHQRPKIIKVPAGREVPIYLADDVELWLRGFSDGKGAHLIVNGHYAMREGTLVDLGKMGWQGEGDGVPAYGKHGRLAWAHCD